MRGLHRVVVRRQHRPHTARPCVRCGEPLADLAAVVGIHAACAWSGSRSDVPAQPPQLKASDDEDLRYRSGAALRDAWDCWHDETHIGMYLAPGCRMAGIAQTHHVDDY